MKNRLPAHGNSGKKPKALALPKGRYARVWLSPEFMAWCQRHHFKPPGGASAVLHTYALKNPGTYTIMVRSERADTGDLYDLPESGKEMS